jgi:hypothetical protein
MTACRSACTFRASGTSRRASSRPGPRPRRATARALVTEPFQLPQLSITLLALRKGAESLPCRPTGQYV